MKGSLRPARVTSQLYVPDHIPKPDYFETVILFFESIGK